MVRERPRDDSYRLRSSGKMRGRLTVAAFHEPNDDSDARKWRHGKLADSFVYGDNTACRKNEYEIFVEIFF